MEVKIFCSNCKVEILRADTDTLKTPLVGSMFKVKKDMEWSLFSPYDQGNDLTCPMCDWTFHDNGKVTIPVGNDFVFGVPEVIIPGILAHVDSFPDAIVGTRAVTENEDAKNKIASQALTNVKENILKEAYKAVGEAMIADKTPDAALEALQKQVEGDKTEVKTEKLEQAQMNKGDWSKPSSIDEGIDMGEEKNPDPRLKKGGRPKGSKNKGAKYQKWWKKKNEQTA